jgi:hypothetical protein
VMRPREGGFEGRWTRLDLIPNKAMHQERATCSVFQVVRFD